MIRLIHLFSDRASSGIATPLLVSIQIIAAPQLLHFGMSIEPCFILSLSSTLAVLESRIPAFSKDANSFYSVKYTRFAVGGIE